MKVGGMNRRTFLARSGAVAGAVGVGIVCGFTHAHQWQPRAWTLEYECGASLRLKPMVRLTPLAPVLPFISLVSVSPRNDTTGSDHHVRRGKPLQQHFVKLGFVYVDDDLEAATVLRRLADGLDERGAIGQHFRYDDLYIGRVVMASGYA